jgi:large subunit ribosomal protein L35
MAKKNKTNSSAKKRFKVTGSGKIRRKKQGKNHLLQKKKANRKRRLSKFTDVHKANRKHIKKLLNR